MAGPESYSVQALSFLCLCYLFACMFDWLFVCVTMSEGDVFSCCFLWSCRQEGHAQWGLWGLSGSWRRREKRPIKIFQRYERLTQIHNELYKENRNTLMCHPYDCMLEINADNRGTGNLWLMDPWCGTPLDDLIGLIRFPGTVILED